MLRIANPNLLSAPSLLGVSHFFCVSDCQPAWTLNLAFKNQQLQHALVGTEKALKRGASHSCRKWWHGGVVLNLEELMLTMWDWHFKGVFASYRLASPLGDILEALLPDIVQLMIDVHNLLVFFLLAQHCFCFALDLGKSIDLSLHTIDFQSTR